MYKISRIVKKFLHKKNYELQVDYTNDSYSLFKQSSKRRIIKITSKEIAEMFQRIQLYYH